MNSVQANATPVSLRPLWPMLLPLAGVLCCLAMASGWLDSERRQFWTADTLADLQSLPADSDSRSPVQYVVQAQRLAPALTVLGGAAGARYVNDLNGVVATLVASGVEAGAPANRNALMLLDESQRSLAGELRAAVAQGERSVQQMIYALIATLLAAALGTALLARSPRKQSHTRPWPHSAVDLQMFDESPVPMVYSDARDQILAVNPAYLRMSGYSDEELLNRPLLFNEAGRQQPEYFDSMRRTLHLEGRWQGELWMRKKHGEAYANKVVRLVICDGNDRRAGYLTISRESLQADEQQRLMLWQAHHDPLTKLPNKIMFEERLTRALMQEQPQGVLLSIDIDRFKEVNDSVGPNLGDQVLMDAAMRLAMCAEEDDTVARIGGDAFVILSQSSDPEQRAQELATNLPVALMEPFRLRDQEIFLQASIGIVSFPKDGSSGAELLQKADAARGEVKRAGGNAVGYFEVEINQRAARRLMPPRARRPALVDGELSPALQPIVALGEKRLLGAEALLRWSHPTLGNISPGEFIPIAESSGLIQELGLWVVEESQRIVARWREGGLKDLRLSLNVSPLQIQRQEDCEVLLDKLQGHNARRLTLEITESALMDHAETARFFIDRARRMGCQVALDDFGTGYSSLAYLREFNFDVLKVDKAFTDRLASPRDLGLVASIISMGKILGMRVVAEGVEERDQVLQLSQVGCHYAQGYLFARPLPLEEFEAFAGENSEQLATVTALASSA